MVVKTEIGDYTTQLLDHPHAVTRNEKFSGPLHPGRLGDLFRAVNVAGIDRGE